MKTPREIYAAYKTMPALQMHQLRVAAVGKLVCDNSNREVNERDVILACLFHDMGNIVKFKLEAFPDAIQPEGLQYWQKQKEEVIQKYGPDQHHVSKAIAQELMLPDTVIQMIANAGTSKIPDIVAGGSYELKILQYADLRVAPFGIVSLTGRFEDFARRYPVDKDVDVVPSAKKLEEQVVAHASVKPEDVNDASVAPLIEELWEYPVS